MVTSAACSASLDPRSDQVGNQDVSQSLSTTACSQPPSVGSKLQELPTGTSDKLTRASSGHTTQTSLMATKRNSQRDGASFSMREKPGTMQLTGLMPRKLSLESGTVDLTNKTGKILPLMPTNKQSKTRSLDVKRLPKQLKQTRVRQQLQLSHPMWRRPSLQFWLTWASMKKNVERLQLLSLWSSTGSP